MAFKNNNANLSDDDCLSFQPFTIFTTCPECEQRNPISMYEIYAHREEQVFVFTCYSCDNHFKVLSPIPAIQKEVIMRKKDAKLLERVPPAQNVCDYCLKDFKSEDIFDSDGIAKVKPCYCTPNNISPPKSPDSAPPSDSSESQSEEEEFDYSKYHDDSIIVPPENVFAYLQQRDKELKKPTSHLPLFKLINKDGKPRRLIQAVKEVNEDNLMEDFSSDDDIVETQPDDDVEFIKEKKNEDEVEYCQCDNNNDDNIVLTPMLTRKATEALRKKNAPLFPSARVSINNHQRKPIQKSRRRYPAKMK